MRGQQSRKPCVDGCVAMQQTSVAVGLLSSYRTGRNVWFFWRKMRGHVHVLLIVSVSFHVHFFQCTVNVLMISDMNYVTDVQFPNT